MSEAEDDNNTVDTSQTDTANIYLNGMTAQFGLTLAKRVLLPESEKEDKPP